MNTLIFRTLCSAITAIMLASCATTPTGISPVSTTPKQLLDDQILVTLPEAKKSEWVQIAEDLAHEYDLVLSGEFPLTSIAVDCLVFKVPENHSMMELLAKLRADKRVILAQKNQVFEGIQSSPDKVYSELSYGPKLVRADRAHQWVTGKGIKIAVIDTGADVKHPELLGTITEKMNFVEGGDASFNTDKHGTAVSGVIGAAINDGIGIDGIAPNAEITVMKSCWYGNSTVSAGAKCSSWSLAKALDAAVSQGVHVINLSLAGPYDELLESILVAANRQGIAIVTASLEKKTNPGFPAQLSFVIPAISASPDGSVSHPAWLKQIESVVAAPGVEIITTSPQASYDVLSGSSLAAAHVTGIIALLLERDPSLTPSTIKRMMTEVSYLAGQPKLIDACKALAKLETSFGC